MNAKQITNVLRRVFKRLYKTDIFGPKTAYPELRQQVESELNMFLSKEIKNVAYQCVSDLVQEALDRGSNCNVLHGILKTHRVPDTPELIVALKENAERLERANGR